LKKINKASPIGIIALEIDGMMFGLRNNRNPFTTLDMELWRLGYK